MKILRVHGKEVFVDDDVYQWAKHFKWQLGNRGHVYTRHTTEANNGYIWLHRIVMDTPEDMLCDHIDRNPLNNQRDNLRNCTKSQNSMNRSTRPNKQGYRGVCIDPRRKKNPYRAYIQKERKRISLGVYPTPEQAAIAYDIHAKEMHGDYAVLNFPDGFPDQI